MNRLIANTVTCTLIGLLSIPTMAQNPATKPTQAVLASRNDIGGKLITMAEDFGVQVRGARDPESRIFREFGNHLLGCAAEADNTDAKNTLR